MYRFAVFGDPIHHSNSPEIHQRFGELVGLEICYEKKQVNTRNFREEVITFFGNGGSGLNVTIPHKLCAYKMALEYSHEAVLAGTCNTLMPSKTGLYGHNTDGLGLLDDLERLGWTVNEARILILGAGGAISGCLGPLLAEKPKEIVIANRSVDKAKALVKRFKRRASAVSLDALDFLDVPFDLVINGISAGLSGITGIQLSDRILNADGACYDLIYNVNEETPFLKMCRSLTDRRSDGLGMLLAQGARSFELWTGIYPDPFAQLTDFGRNPKLK